MRSASHRVRARTLVTACRFNGRHILSLARRRAHEWTSHHKFYSHLFIRSVNSVYFVTSKSHFLSYSASSLSHSNHVASPFSHHAALTEFLELSISCGDSIARKFPKHLVLRAGCNVVIDSEVTFQHPFLEHSVISRIVRRVTGLSVLRRDHASHS